MTEPVLSRNANLHAAVATIERTRRFIAAVVDDEGALLGVVSDGDIRRALLAGHDLDTPVELAMTRRPITGPVHASARELYDIMARSSLAAMPVVDETGRFVRIALAGERDGGSPHPAGGDAFAAAVVMAGGEGRRLYPLTADLPKPMIDVGGAPLLERQIRNMARSGVQRIFIATNYLGHVIEEHFGDGGRFGVEIRYLREPKKLGTAGALSLLPPLDAGPVLVVNGDVLTGSNYESLLSFHNETKAFVTVAAAVYRMDVPYGVLQVSGHRALGVEEKPTQTFLCNAGLYVLSAAALSLVPHERQFNMTDLINTAIRRDKPVSVFPIHEYWTDIGNPGDLERARREFGER